MPDRHSATFRLGMVILLLIVLFGLAAGAFAAAIKSQSDRVEKLLGRQACIASLTASFQGAVADALATPPAPNAAREKTVEKITDAAHKLRHLDRACP